MQTVPVTIFLCLTLVVLSFQQPPGVPPKGHDQQFQQQQQQQQHQQQQPQQHQQQQHQAGGHGHDHRNAMHFSSEVHNAEHILEHLQNVVATKKKEDMSEEELEFHYFKLHDYDNNNKLDGVEIGKALTHFHDDDKPDNSAQGPVRDSGSGHGAGRPAAKARDLEVMLDEDIARQIDIALDMFDVDKDGYITYVEFKIKQKMGL